MRRLMLMVAASCAACGDAGVNGGRLHHDGYVWQRQWTPAVTTAMAVSASRITQWRVLAAEVDSTGRFAETGIDAAAVGSTGKPVVLVIRISGRLREWEAGGVVSRILAIERRWRTSGLPIAGIEIDHDCATNRLAAYTMWLAALQDVRTRGLTLSVTALPDWLRSRDLSRLLARVDESVLQVHGVDDPSQGLFDERDAASWIDRWSRVTPVPFRVALPTYGSRVAWDGAGRVAAIESENSSGGAAAGLELFVRPEQVSALLMRLERRPPRGLAGIVWFRLPTSSDRRAWSLRTWHAVIDGRITGSDLEAQAVPSAAGGTLDVSVGNPGEIDRPLPELVRVVATGCEAADAVTPYVAQRDGDGVRFWLGSRGVLRARERRTIGWVRCAAGGHIDVR